MRAPRFFRSLLHLPGHHRIESRILIGFLAVAAICFGLVQLGSAVADGDTFAFDRLILTALRSASDAAVPIGHSGLVTIMIDITALGGGTVLTIITIFAVGYLGATHRWRMAIFVGASLAAGGAANRAIKLFFERARPDVVPHLVEVNSASFPSGHAMNSALVFLTLAMLVARTQSRRRVRIYLIASAVFLTILIGCSRVYLGVHWPSDVLAGWGVGGLWAVLSVLAFKALQRSGSITAKA